MGCKSIIKNYVGSAHKLGYRYVGSVHKLWYRYVGSSHKLWYNYVGSAHKSGYRYVGSAHKVGLHQRLGTQIWYHSLIKAQHTIWLGHHSNLVILRGPEHNFSIIISSLHICGYLLGLSTKIWYQYEGSIHNVYICI